MKHYRSKFKYDNTRRVKRRSENSENWNLFARFNSYEYRLFGVIINAFVIITFSLAMHVFTVWKMMEDTTNFR